MAFKVSEGSGIATLDSGDALGVIFFADQFDRAPKGNLKLGQDWDHLSLQACIVRADEIPGLRVAVEPLE